MGGHGGGGAAASDMPPWGWVVLACAIAVSVAGMVAVLCLDPGATHDEPHKEIEKPVEGA